MLATSDGAALRQSLQAHFGAKLTGDALDECVGLCSAYNLDAQSLHDKWDVLAIKNKWADTVTQEHVDALRASLSKAAERSVRRAMDLSTSDIYTRRAGAAATGGLSGRLVGAGALVVSGSAGTQAPSRVLTRGSLDALLGPSGPLSTAGMVPPGAPLRSIGGSSGAGATALHTPRGKTSSGAFRPTSDAAASTASFTSPTPGARQLVSPSVSGVQSLKSPLSGKSPTKLFSQRSDSGKVVDTLNPHVPPFNATHVPATILARESKVEVSLVDTVKPFRYMNAKVSTKSMHLDAHLQDAADRFLDHYMWDALDNPCMPCQQELKAVGMICVDALGQGARLNEQSVMLQVPRALGGGRVRLDLAELTRRGKEYALFPGKIVSVAGKNPDGAAFIVDTLYDMPPLQSPPYPIRELMSYYHVSEKNNNKSKTLIKPEDIDMKDDAGEKGEEIVLRSTPVSMAVAAGPFTLEDSLEFEPLEALISTLVKNPPNVLVLCGPFIDVAHPFLASGRVTESLDSIFQHQILSRVARLDMTTVLLVPHPCDATSEYVCVPQPPLSVSGGRMGGEGVNDAPVALPPNVVMLSNPVTISLNEIVMTISTTEVLFHLSGEEIRRAGSSAVKGGSASKTDRLQRLAGHLLEQGNTFPLFPPPATSNNALIEWNEFGKMSMGVCPHFLITPSGLKAFAKLAPPLQPPMPTDGDGTDENAGKADDNGGERSATGNDGTSSKCVPRDAVLVNPGFVARRVNGTYARITVHPLQFPEELWDAYRKNDAEELDKAIEAAVVDRTRIDILKV